MYAIPKIEMDETMKEIKELAQQIRVRKAILRQESHVKKQSTKPVTPRTTTARARERSVGRLREEFENLGVDMTETEEVSYQYLYIRCLLPLIIPHHKLILFFRPTSLEHEVELAL